MEKNLKLYRKTKKRQRGQAFDLAVKMLRVSRLEPSPAPDSAILLLHKLGGGRW